MAVTVPADCLADAARLILDHGLTLDHVESVDYDSILYLNALKHPRTLWLHRPERGPLRIQMVQGFAPQPPDGWHDERPGDRLTTGS